MADDVVVGDPVVGEVVVDSAKTAEQIQADGEVGIAPLRLRAARLLREDIYSQFFQPGDRLREAQLCDRYEVSRTVVREALRQLESERLITMLPNRGPIVTVLNEADISAIYAVRASLEGLAGELFAANASDAQVERMVAWLSDMEEKRRDGDVAGLEETKDEFYRLLFAGAGNEVLADSLGTLHRRIGVFRRYAFEDQGRIDITLEDLRRIVDRLRHRDVVGAGRACADHVRLAGRLALAEHRQRAL